MADLRQYPSGFRGSAWVKNTAPIDAERMTHRLFSASAITTPEGRSASLRVCQIWENYTSGAPEVKTFEFREFVLRNAVKVFGRDYLYDWIEQQKISPNWDEYHQRWICETLEYVFRNRPRQFSPSNWIALLSATPAKEVRNQDNRLVSEIFFDKERIGENFTMTQFFIEWLKQPRGFEDLVESLFVLYGSR